MEERDKRGLMLKGERKAGTTSLTRKGEKESRLKKKNLQQQKFVTTRIIKI